MNLLSISLVIASLLLLLVPGGIKLFYKKDLSLPLVYGLASVGVVGLVVLNILVKGNQDECPDSCPAGPQGKKGDKGDKGDAGPKGDVGPAGPTGPHGSRGLIGATGPRGMTGPRGKIGQQGVPGHWGPIGPAGPTGPQGKTGQQGGKGDTGDVGPRGLMGPTGPRGKTGQKGDKGGTGDVGPRGSPGDTGPVGDSGPTGPQGPKGNTGDQGPRGKVGTQGPMGDCTNCPMMMELLPNQSNPYSLSYNIDDITYYLYRGNEYSNYENKNYYLNLKGFQNDPGDQWFAGVFKNDGEGKVSVINPNDKWTSFMVFVVGDDAQNQCGPCAGDLVSSGGSWPNSCVVLNDSSSGYTTNLATNTKVYKSNFGFGILSCGKWVVLDPNTHLLKLADNSTTIVDIFNWNVEYM